MQICFAYATGSQTWILYALLVPPIKYFILFPYTITFQRIRLLLMPLSANSLLRSYTEVNMLPHIFSYMFQTACNKPLQQVNENTKWLTLGLWSKKSSYFYGTGYVLYPYFLDYFLNIFFLYSINKLNWSQNIAFIQISHFSRNYIEWNT